MDHKTGCGTPDGFPKRQKRSTPDLGGSIPFRRISSVSLKRLVEGVRGVLREVKHMWTHNILAGTVCSPIIATGDERCWNGESEAL